MQKTQEIIGILGGTFDPIHNAHLQVALEVKQAFHLNKIHFIPCFSPVHRPPPIATAAQRLAMVQYAIYDHPDFIANDCEIQRQMPSYTIDTLFGLKNTLTETTLCFIIGMDAFIDFNHWHQWQAILKLCHLLVVVRPDYPLPTTGVMATILKTHLQEDKQYINTHTAGGIFLHTMVPIAISATYIREQIAQGQVPENLLPKRVCDYIKQHHLYE